MSLADPNTWAPNESAADLWFERGWLDGVFVGAVAYGVHASLFFTTLSLLRQRPRSTWKDNGWIAYIVVLFVVSSVGNGLQLKMAELGFIGYRNYPGPKAGWEAGNQLVIACNAVYVVNTWLQDGLLLYRFRVIVGGPLLLMFLPALMFAGTVGVGCVLIFILTRPGVVLWASISTKLLTAYFSISIAFNLILTLAIVGKLVTTRHRASKAVTSMGQYTSVSAMFIESACLYSACGVILLVALGLKSAALQNLILPTLSQAQSIAPVLIIMRVAQGQAWTKDTPSTLVPSQPSTPKSSGESSEFAERLNV
ncbi:hypothetical protein EXIGLDRAFT_725534 [Exidia glandulosa HHB12029]|uniref:Uncharacterized protein n=1 Tax=Exidia glandulosa HHB12029 TaxID=1314781 RepID=A0A165DZ69_EXIGL|nr:hypothetical protein EXIGLDRAFT_725534 [Exidia glandulosa HHB12029]